MSSKSFLDKVKVALSFSRSAKTYDMFSNLQKHMAGELVKTVKALKLEPRNILDVGTGTGEVAFQLGEHYGHAKIIGCDIAPGMIKASKEKNKTSNITFEVADAEDLPYQEGQFDLVVSNATFQWVEDLFRTFSEAKRVLKKDGFFIFLTFGPKTLIELSRAYKETINSKAKYLHRYKGLNETEGLLKDNGFEIINIFSKFYKQNYADLKTMFRTIKGVGALNASTELPRGLRGKMKMKSLMEHYKENFSDAKGIFATYEVIQAVCRKTS